MRTTRSVLAPTVALVAVLGMTGCTQVSSSGSKTSGSGASSSAQETKSADSPSASETSSESPSESTSESSSESSDSSSSSSESSASSSSSSSSSRATIDESAARAAASKGETRACTMKELGYKGSAQFCSKDSNEITADYKGQRVYFTTAVQYQSTASYSFTVSLGSQSETKQLGNSSVPSGQLLTLTAYVPMQAPGTYKIEFKKNGATFSTKEVKVATK